MIEYSKKKEYENSKKKWSTREEYEAMEFYNVGPKLLTPPDSMVDEVFRRNLNLECTIVQQVSSLRSYLAVALRRPLLLRTSHQ